MPVTIKQRSRTVPKSARESNEPRSWSAYCLKVGWKIRKFYGIGITCSCFSCGIAAKQHPVGFEGHRVNIGLADEIHPNGG
jgi:hypothetical protein